MTNYVYRRPAFYRPERSALFVVEPVDTGAAESITGSITIQVNSASTTRVGRALTGAATIQVNAA